ncbi:MAG TPA: hypothetical protein VJT32_13270 [bacterium]|nr:hypothetical protein [bacterium]
MLSFQRDPGPDPPFAAWHGVTSGGTVWSAEHVQFECSLETLAEDEIVDPLDRLDRQSDHQVPIRVEREGSAGMPHLIGDVFRALAGHAGRLAYFVPEVVKADPVDPPRA